jgi:lipopolysaccharide export LptBFGC system permease protein LptF
LLKDLSTPLRILPRYCLRLFTPVFLLCLSVFTGVLLMNNFLRLFNMALLKGISLFWILGCFFRLLPYFLSLALPMSFLVATMVTLGQLSEQGEITALRASGFSFLELTWPFLAMAAAGSAALLLLNHKTAPEGFHSFRKQYAAAAQQISKVDLQPGSFLRLGPWKLYASQADPETGRLEGVYLVRADAQDAGLRVRAREGRLTITPGKSLDLELTQGGLQLPNKEPERFTAGRFSRYRLSVPVTGAPEGQESLEIPEITSAQLRQRIVEPGRDAQSRNEYRVELALRSAVALAPFIFFWIAAPLGLRLSRHSRGLGFAASLLVLMVYYGLVAMGVGIGRRNDRLSSSAPWLADVTALALGAVLTRRTVSR